VPKRQWSYIFDYDLDEAVEANVAAEQRCFNIEEGYTIQISDKFHHDLLHRESV